MKCRHCHSELSLNFINLGSAPPSNAYLPVEALHAAERWYPLNVMVCQSCWLVQTEDYADSGELFSPDYAYFSSFSSTWLQHAESYVAAMHNRFGLGAESMVVEVAANDGYLLQYVKQRGTPCYGIEPTASTASAARQRGITIIQEFFGRKLAERLCTNGKQADLIAANNVLAHVPDINDFVAGFATLLKPHGVATFEFPHLLQLVNEGQFDTIYHEHFSYLSLTSVSRIFSENGLMVFDVETLPTHGGSLRVYAQRSDYNHHMVSEAVATILNFEQQAGMTAANFYAGFQSRAEAIKYDLLEFLIQARRKGETVAAYGAAAKGNTLLNFAGVRSDLIRYVVDRNPAKQGKYMPGSRIPIVAETHLQQDKPRWIIILPWNLSNELKQQLAYTSEWGAQFITAIPKLTVSG